MGQRVTMGEEANVAVIDMSLDHPGLSTALGLRNPGYRRLVRAVIRRENRDLLGSLAARTGSCRYGEMRGWMSDSTVALMAFSFGGGVSCNPNVYRDPRFACHVSRRGSRDRRYS